MGKFLISVGKPRWANVFYPNFKTRHSLVYLVHFSRLGKKIQTGFCNQEKFSNLIIGKVSTPT